MSQVGAQLGSVVNVTVPLPSGGTRTAPFRVVSQVSFPVLAGAVSLGTGAVFTLAGYENAVCPAGPTQPACRDAVVESTNGGMLVSVAPGPRGQAAINHYFDTYQSLTALAVAPTSLINFGEAVNFPLIFGAILAIFGAATLLHLLVVSVSRRRREIGLLKVLGFVNGQVASTVAWQATTLALVGLVIGIPLGLVIGKAVWKAFANNLGAVPVSAVPIWLIAVLAAGVIVVANLIAVIPALMATRSRAGELLRTQ
jgi:FtsX-like permease family